MHFSLLFPLPAYLVYYLPVYLSAFLPANLPYSLPAYFSAFLPANLPFFLPAYLSAFLPANLPYSLPTNLPAFLPANLTYPLPAYLSAFLSAYLPTTQHVLPICPPTCSSAPSIRQTLRQQMCLSLCPYFYLSDRLLICQPSWLLFFCTCPSTCLSACLSKSPHPPTNWLSIFLPLCMFLNLSTHLRICLPI
jgi:hypothetical protein